MLEAVHGAIALGIDDLEHHEVVLRLDEDEVTVTASNLLDLLRDSGESVGDHPEHLLDLLLGLLLRVGNQVEQVHVTLHRYAEHCIVYLVHLGARQELLLVAARILLLLFLGVLRLFGRRV
jgi:hypothetical protein